MAKRRYIKHKSLESIMGRKKVKDRKRAERKKAKQGKSPTFVRFFEQRETATQARDHTKELLNKSPEKLAVDNCRQHLIELLEEETDRELTEEKIKRLSDLNVKTERTPGDRQSTKKAIAKERRGRKAA